MERPLIINHKKDASFDKVVILDRDGVVNKSALPHEYNKTPDHILILPGVYNLVQLASIHSAGIFIFTNQQWIANEGNEAFLKAMDYINNSIIAKTGVSLVATYCCPHRHGDANCNCRKPKPRMLETIMNDFKISPDRCIVVGDTDFDILVAEGAGIKNHILVPSDHPEEAFDGVKTFLESLHK